MTIYLDAPNLGELEKKNLVHCIDTNFVSTVGPFVTEFESKFGDYVGAKKSVSVQSGTAALHLALLELGIGEGDEVILPALSFVATANPILYVGAAPVFVDVDPDTWNIDPNEVARAISPRTKAIIAVHLYGNPCDMNALSQISKEFGIPIIEDATESLGATYEGQYTGTLGEYGCFSFNGNKIITTGGGGMIVTNDEKHGEHLKFLVNQARDIRKGYFHSELGYNYRMTNLEASLGLAQMKRLDSFLERKRAFSCIYRERLSAIPGVTFQKESVGGKSSWWLVSLILEREGVDISSIQIKLKEKGIPTRRIFVPMVDFPHFQPFVSREYSVARSIFQNGINLPSSTLNSEDGIWKTAEILTAVLK